MDQERYRRELEEALYATDDALECLYDAQSELDSARAWGIYDIVGGGFLATAFKRNKMNNAEDYMNEARRALQEFSEELEDVDRMVDIDFNRGELLAFADYFMDGFLADIIAQGNINDARRNVADTIREVERIRRELERRLHFL